MERERIELRLAVEHGVVRAVDVASSRAIDAARALTRRPIDEALELVPLMFALCGRAHRLAAVSAVEAALGIPARAEVAHGRAMLGVAESIEGHARTMLLEWPRLLDERADVASFAAIRREVEAFARAVDPIGALVRTGLGPRGSRSAKAGPVDDGRRGLGEAPRAVAARLRTRVLEAGLVPSVLELDAVKRWAAAGGSVAARVLRSVLDARMEALGASDVPLLTPIDVAWLEAMVARDPGGFPARPSVDGAARESGVIAEQHAAPVVRAVIGAHGRGLLARFVARLAGVHAALDALEAAEVVDGVAPIDPARTDGVGSGLAPTSRGVLAHHLAVKGGQIVAWTTVAPTEWSFHPEGAVRALVGVKMDDAERFARWHAGALDACVPCEIRVEA